MDPQLRKADQAASLGHNAQQEEDCTGDVVERPENRAINLKQLHRLWAFVREHADESGVLNGWYD